MDKATIRAKVIKHMLFDSASPYRLLAMLKLANEVRGAVVKASWGSDRHAHLCVAWRKIAVVGRHNGQFPWLHKDARHCITNLLLSLDIGIDGYGFMPRNMPHWFIGACIGTVPKGGLTSAPAGSWSIASCNKRRLVLLDLIIETLESINVEIRS